MSASLSVDQSWLRSLRGFQAASNYASTLKEGRLGVKECTDVLFFSSLESALFELSRTVETLKSSHLSQRLDINAPPWSPDSEYKRQDKVPCLKPGSEIKQLPDPTVLVLIQTCV